MSVSFCYLGRAGCLENRLCGWTIIERPVIGVEANRIVGDRFSGYRTKPGQTWGVPVWEFATQGD